MPSKRETAQTTLLAAALVSASFANGCAEERLDTSTEDTTDTGFVDLCEADPSLVDERCCREPDFSALLDVGQGEWSATGSFVFRDETPWFVAQDDSVEAELLGFGLGLLPDLTQIGVVSASIVAEQDGYDMVEFFRTEIRTLDGEALLILGHFTPYLGEGWKISSNPDDATCPLTRLDSIGEEVHAKPTNVAHSIGGLPVEWESWELWSGDDVEVGGYRVHVGISHSYPPGTIDDAPDERTSWFIAKKELFE